MGRPNRFLLIQGIVLLFLMVCFSMSALLVKTKFWVVVLLILAIIMAITGVSSLLISFRDREE